MNEFDELVEIVKKLREECPWDMEQTHESLSRHLIEEAYELLDSLASIEEKDSNYEHVKDELGDLLLQILLHSKIAEENNKFAIVDVIKSLQAKLIERHPHVFGDVKLDSAEEVEKQWETLKQKDSDDSIFDDINSKLPSIFQKILISIQFRQLFQVVEGFQTNQEPQSRNPLQQFLDRELLFFVHYLSSMSFRR